MPQTLPSVVMTMPIVLWSLMTRRVPSSAARDMGTSSSNQGVATMRSTPSSNWPDAPSTI